MADSELTMEQRLAASLRELSAGNTIERITIKEIADLTGVNRTTFYKHFQDKYELIEWILTEELLEPIRPLIRNGMNQEAVELLIRNVECDIRFYKKLIQMEEPIAFMDVATQCVKRFLLEVLGEIVTKDHSSHRWLNKDVLAHYYAYSMSFVLIEWVRKDMLFTPEEMAEAYQYLITHSMEDAVREMQ